MIGRAHATAIGSFACALAALVAACSSNGSSPSTTTSTTTGTGGASTTTTTAGVGGASGAGGATSTATTTSGEGGGVADAGALGAAMPQVVSAGAPVVLTNPKVMVVTCDGDPTRTVAEAFIPNYAQSTAWAQQTSEYGVGPLTAATPQHLANCATTDGEFQAVIAANTTGAEPPWGNLDPETIYMLFVPQGANFLAEGEACCSSYGGFHDLAVIGNVQVPYAVICNCTGDEELTIATSHETVEAATDPFITGYAMSDDPHAVWSTVGGEVGDMCEFSQTSQWQPADMQYSIQRMWSNKAAAAGHDPCVGAPTEPYYQTIPELPDTAWYDSVYVGYSVPTSGLKVELGQTRSLTLDVLSDAAGGPYTVQIIDYSSQFLGGPQMLSASVPPNAFMPGDKVVAQITVNATATDGEVFAVATSPSDPNAPTTVYYGLVFQ